MNYRYGMIHGRFQPFHNEHLRYFRTAWEQCENVIVGITNPDPSTIVEDPLNEHRHRPDDNPYTFTERLIMIQESLRDEGYPMERIFIVPFPVHHPDRWSFYVPRGTAMFVVVYSDWERSKAERIRAAGLNVIAIDTFEKTVSGRQVRSLIAGGGDWENLVPPAVARFLRERRDA